MNKIEQRRLDSRNSEVLSSSETQRGVSFMKRVAEIASFVVPMFVVGDAAVHAEKVEASGIEKERFASSYVEEPMGYAVDPEVDYEVYERPDGRTIPDNVRKDLIASQEKLNKDAENCVEKAAVAIRQLKNEYPNLSEDISVECNATGYASDINTEILGADYDTTPKKDGRKREMYNKNTKLAHVRAESAVRAISNKIEEAMEKELKAAEKIKDPKNQEKAIKEIKDTYNAIVAGNAGGIETGRDGIKVNGENVFRGATIEGLIDANDMKILAELKWNREDHDQIWNELGKKLEPFFGARVDGIFAPTRPDALIGGSGAMVLGLEDKKGLKFSGKVGYYADTLSAQACSGLNNACQAEGVKGAFLYGLQAEKALGPDNDGLAPGAYLEGAHSFSDNSIDNFDRQSAGLSLALGVDKLLKVGPGVDLGIRSGLFREKTASADAADLISADQMGMKTGVDFGAYLVVYPGEFKKK